MEVSVSDGYTYSFTLTYPVVHESPEAALCELEELAMAAAPNHDYFEFGGYEWSCDEFVAVDGEDLIFVAPTFLTVDEFFATVEEK